MRNALLHVSDWNMRDKWYHVPADLLKEFKTQLRTTRIEDAWEWFTSKVQYPGDHRSANLPILYLTTLNVNEMDEEFFLDYNNHIESIGEWDDDEFADLMQEEHQ